MSRIALAARILRNLQYKSLLDVGCREGDLMDEVPSNVEYAGADLFPDKRGRVRYLGDIAKMEIPRKYDVVVALDILEHLESPSTVFDRLVGWTNQHLLVSFPNCYDLKSRVRFAAGGPLGGKYLFREDEPVDRHRWLMTRDEILDFYHVKSRKHAMELQVIDLTYGSSGRATMVARAGRVLSALLPAAVTTQTVCGLFTRH